MKRHFRPAVVMVAPALLGIMIGFAWSQSLQVQSARAEATRAQQAERPKVQRFGSVIGLRPEKKEYYVKLHANTWPGVLRQIRESNIRNYSIYLTELEGKLYLFSYFEYLGEDFDADMKKMAADAETRRWWKETDPCQFRIPGTPEGEQWLKIPEVFHTD